MTNLLHCKPQFNYEVTDLNDKECACSAQKTVKSGKFAKTNIKIQRQEIWPHITVSKKYTKSTSFDNLKFELFVAGESKIIYSMMQENVVQATRRLRVLTLVSHWMCKVKHWPTVRAIYESIIEEVELGEHEWEDDFSGYEPVLPVYQHTAHKVEQQAGEKPRRDRRCTGARVSKPTTVKPMHHIWLTLNQMSLRSQSCTYVLTVGLIIKRGKTTVKRNAHQKSNHGWPGYGTGEHIQH